MTKIIEKISHIRKIQKMTIQNNKSIGFVPTMGNLHQGHASLLQRARLENNIVVLSIFVNKIQFNSERDFDNYPRTFKSDIALAGKENVDYVFAPSESTLYPDHYQFQIQEKTLSKIMEGKHRPGHFEGMLTVIMKLLQIVKPHRAYFGEKDHQQLNLIKAMTNAFFLETEIINCPTVREETGLAFSSRNALLLPEHRAKAHYFYQLLSSDNACSYITKKLIKEGFTVDYIEEHEGRRFGAVCLNNVRLIDNVLIK